MSYYKTIVEKIFINCIRDSINTCTIGDLLYRNLIAHSHVIVALKWHEWLFEKFTLIVTYCVEKEVVNWLESLRILLLFWQ